MKKRGGGAPPPVYNQQLPRLQLRERPSYAPRGASIPCGLTRLRILPVTTWVGRILPRSATFLPSNVRADQDRAAQPPRRRNHLRIQAVRRAGNRHPQRGVQERD